MEVLRMRIRKRKYKVPRLKTRKGTQTEKGFPVLKYRVVRLILIMMKRTEPSMRGPPLPGPTLHPYRVIRLIQLFLNKKKNKNKMDSKNNDKVS